MLPGSGVNVNVRDDGAGMNGPPSSETSANTSKKLLTLKLLSNWGNRPRPTARHHWVENDLNGMGGDAMERAGRVEFGHGGGECAEFHVVHS
jgi:hypothetical protein